MRSTFYGSEASDDLFVSLVDHGVFCPGFKPDSSTSRSSWPAHKVFEWREMRDNTFNEFDFAGSEALERHELANIKPRSLSSSLWAKVVRSQDCPLRDGGILWTRSSAWLKGLQPTFFRFRQNPVRTFPLQTQSYPETRSIQCAEGYSTDSSTSAENFVICSLTARQTGPLFKLQALSPFSVTDATNEIH